MREHEVERAITTWTQGDYAVVESWIAPASRVVLDLVDFEARPTLLDVACGMGTVAVEAATRGAQVTGLDLTPRMLEEARRRAGVAGVSVRWVQGSFDDLATLGSFDIIVSTFGVIFASHPEVVAGQLASACRSGGRIIVTSWHDDGAFGCSGIDRIREIAPELPEGPAPDRWSDETALRSFFDGTGVRLADQAYRSMSLPFASVAEAFDQFVLYSGPWKQLMSYMESIGKADRARAAVESHLASHATSGSDGRIHLNVSYVVSTLERRRGSESV